MSKLRILIICLIAFSLTGCIPVNEYTITNRLASKFEFEYRDKVYELFGDDATLNNIEGELRASTADDVYKISYYASGKLKGDLVIDNVTYNSYYDPVTLQELSLVHEKDVVASLCNRLPFDQDKIIYGRVMPDTDGYAAFVDVKDDTDYFETALLSTTMYFGLNTSEDLRQFNDEQLLEKLEQYAHEPWNNGHKVSISIINVDTSDAINISIDSEDCTVVRSWEEQDNG